MWQKIKEFLLRSAATVTAFFVLVWLGAWLSNALFNTKFELKSLQEMYLSIVLPKLAFHGVDSKYNSPPNEPPNKGGS